MTTSECRSKFQSGGSPTETQNGNPADDIRMMQNPAYATTERWNRFESISPTESHYVNGAEEVPMMENPAYVAHVYSQVHAPHAQSGQTQACSHAMYQPQHVHLRGRDK